MEAKRCLVLHGAAHDSSTAAEGDILVFSDGSSNVQEKLDSIAKEGLVDEVKCVSGCIPDDSLQMELFALLKPRGKLMIEGITSRELGQEIAVDLKIAGFFRTMVTTDPGRGERFIVTEKPAAVLDASSVAAVKIATRPMKGLDLSSAEAKSTIASTTSTAAATTSAAEVTITTTNTWKMSLEDNDDQDEGELMDENDLTDDLVLKSLAVECGPPTGVAGKKRACANCSCGLKEIEEEEAKTGVESKIDKSGCGGCSKGDAFRCAGCPFLGQPAFEKGTEKVMLAMMDDI